MPAISQSAPTQGQRRLSTNARPADMRIGMGMRERKPRGNYIFENRKIYMWADFRLCMALQKLIAARNAAKDGKWSAAKGELISANNAAATILQAEIPMEVEKLRHLYDIINAKLLKWQRNSVPLSPF